MSVKVYRRQLQLLAFRVPSTSSEADVAGSPSAILMLVLFKGFTNSLEMSSDKISSALHVV